MPEPGTEPETPAKTDQQSLYLRLRAVVDTMMDPHVLLNAVRDGTGRIIDFVFADANPAACEFNRLSREQLIGVPLLGQHPAAGTTDLFNSYVKVVETGEPLVLDDWTYPQDMFGGELRRYDVRAVKVGDGLSQSWRDVTDRFSLLLQKEQLVRTLNLAVEVSQLGVWIWNFADDRFLFDESIYKIYGADQQERDNPDTVGFWQSRIVPADREMVEQAMLRGRDAKTGFEATFRIQLPDGRIRHIQGRGVVDCDTSGTAARMIGINRDITGQVEYEHELHVAKEGLESANALLVRYQGSLEEKVRERTIELAAARDAAESASRAKSAFLATMSHEMRTPLSHIQGMGSLLMMDSQPDSRKRHVDIMMTASKRLLNLIDSVLEYSRSESGEIRIEMTRFDPHALLREAEAAIGQTAGDKGLATRLEIADGMPATMRGDPERLLQVLGILLDNAVKFSSKGTITLRAKPAGTDEASKAFRFEVEDEGIGMPGKMKAGEFRVFTQADSSLSRKYEGIGLGLSLADRLVRLMGGELDFRSTPGEGSLFWFTVPV